MADESFLATLRTGLDNGKKATLLQKAMEHSRIPQLEKNLEFYQERLSRLETHIENVMGSVVWLPAVLAQLIGTAAHDGRCVLAIRPSINVISHLWMQGRTPSRVKDLATPDEIELFLTLGIDDITTPARIAGYIQTVLAAKSMASILVKEKGEPKVFENRAAAQEYARELMEKLLVTTKKRIWDIQDDLKLERERFEKLKWRQLLEAYKPASNNL